MFPFFFQFNQYIRKYLAMYPDTADADIPRFEDFDLNHDGMVTFDEWQMYLDRHREARTLFVLFCSVSTTCLPLLLHHSTFSPRRCTYRVVPKQRLRWRARQEFRDFCFF